MNHKTGKLIRRYAKEFSISRRALSTRWRRMPHWARGPFRRRLVRVDPDAGSGS
jgi:hypothetical protein